MFVPAILLVRLLRPLVRVRFGFVLMHKIGHCPIEAELYLLERAAGIQPKGTIDLFYFERGTDGQPANAFAAHLAKRALLLHPLVEFAAKANTWIPGGQDSAINIHCRDRYGFGDVDRLMARLPQQIDFTQDEERLGQEQLRRLGVPSAAKFICFHIRSSSYWSERRPGIGNDSDFRNSRVENYFPAMLAAAEKGYYVLRLGASTEPPLPDLHPRIIDYATKSRTEFMDVYLAARCFLMVSTASGIDAISYMFRRPILFANVVAWGYLSLNMVQPFSCMFKAFVREGRPMTFPEIVSMGAQDFTTSAEFVKAGIELEENSPEEILEALNEMLGRLDGSYHDDTDANELQRRLHAIVKRVPRYADWQFNMSVSYLRRHRDWLNEPNANTQAANTHGAARAAQSPD